MRPNGSANSKNNEDRYFSSEVYIKKKYGPSARTKKAVAARYVAVPERGLAEATLV